LETTRIQLISALNFFKRWPVDLGSKLFFKLPPLGQLQLAALFPKITQVTDGLNDPKATPQGIARLFSQYQKSDIIGVCSHANIGARNSLYTLRLARSYAPGATTIMGGYHSTFFAKKWVMLGSDIVIRNEGETTYNYIVSKIKNNEKITKDDLLGTTYSEEWFKFYNSSSEITKNREKYKLTDPKNWKSIKEFPLVYEKTKIINRPDRPFVENLDAFPLPDRAKLNLKNYFLPFKGKGYSTTIETTRGCPYKCDFCSTGAMWKRQARYKSVDRIIEEIRNCNDLGINKYLIIDESWGVNPKRDNILLDRINELDFAIQWGIQIRPDTIVQQHRLIRKAGKSGCKLALVGFESISQKMLDSFSKGTDVRMLYKASEILKKSGIFIIGYFMIGYPGETKKERIDTLLAVPKLSDISFISQFMPYCNQDMAINTTKLNQCALETNNPENQENGSLPLHFFTFINKNTNNLIKNKKYEKYIEIRNDLRKGFSQLILNPDNLWDWLMPVRSERRKFRKPFLKYFYGEIIRNLLSFRPNRMLNFMRGI
jgi:radical SAM superfamily enzyme YgiQ (UPF0313 family)